MITFYVHSKVNDSGGVTHIVTCAEPFTAQQWVGTVNSEISEIPVTFLGGYISMIVESQALSGDVVIDGVRIVFGVECEPVVRENESQEGSK